MSGLGVAVEPHLEVDGLFFAEACAQHRDFIDMAAQPPIRRFRRLSISVTCRNPIGIIRSVMTRALTQNQVLRGAQAPIEARTGQ